MSNATEAFKNMCRKGNASVQESYAGQLKEDLASFLAERTTGDLMLLHEVLRAAVDMGEPQRDSLAGAMAEIVGTASDAPSMTTEADEIKSSRENGGSSPETLAQLRKRLRDFTDFDGRYAYAARLMTPEFLASLTEHQRVDLAVCALMLKEDGGSTTPFESFLSNFLKECFWRPPTVNSLKDMVEQLEDDLESALATARKIAADYPDELGKAA